MQSHFFTMLFQLTLHCESFSWYYSPHDITCKNGTYSFNFYSSSRNVVNRPLHCYLGEPPALRSGIWPHTTPSSPGPTALPGSGTHPAPKPGEFSITESCSEENRGQTEKKCRDWRCLGGVERDSRQQWQWVQRVNPIPLPTSPYILYPRRSQILHIAVAQPIAS
jgi:hypothetical protein